MRELKRKTRTRMRSMFREELASLDRSSSELARREAKKRKLNLSQVKKTQKRNSKE